MEQRYVVDNEYEGAFVGTLEECQGHIECEGWNIGDCVFFEVLPSQVRMKLTPL